MNDQRRPKEIQKQNWPNGNRSVRIFLESVNSRQGFFRICEDASDGITVSGSKKSYNNKCHGFAGQHSVSTECSLLQKVAILSRQNTSAAVNGQQQ